MDFAWVVGALRHGLKVTRKDWLLANPPMYLYMVTEKKPDGKHIIKMRSGNCPDFEWTPTAEQMLTVDDWEEYMDPKKEPAKAGKDWTDCAGGVVCTGEDTGYMAEQLELLADIYAEKISQRVVQLLQKADVPLSKEDTNHMYTVYHRRRS